MEMEKEKEKKKKKKVPLKKNYNPLQKSLLYLKKMPKIQSNQKLKFNQNKKWT